VTGAGPHLPDGISYGHSRFRGGLHDCIEQASCACRGTIIAIEGLVELGMTPAQAIVSASRNVAIASKGLKEFGTIEAGKVADILVLGGDPLTDISNIRKLVVLIRDGKTIDRARLPIDPVMYRPE